MQFNKGPLLCGYINNCATQLSATINQLKLNFIHHLMDCKLEFKIEVCYFGSVGGIFEMQICNRDH